MLCLFHCYISDVTLSLFSLNHFLVSFLIVSPYCEALLSLFCVKDVIEIVYYHFKNTVLTSEIHPMRQDYVTEN